MEEQTSDSVAAEEAWILSYTRLPSVIHNFMLNIIFSNVPALIGAKTFEFEPRIAFR
jgi:hypothetical protein